MGRKYNFPRPFTGGDDLVIEVTVQDGSGEPLSLSGLQSAKFDIATAPGEDPLVSKSLGAGVAVTDASIGRLNVTLDASDTEGMSGAFEYELEVVDASGKRQTPVYGRIRFRLAVIPNP